MMNFNVNSVQPNYGKQQVGFSGNAYSKELGHEASKLLAKALKIESTKPEPKSQAALMARFYRLDGELLKMAGQGNAHLNREELIPHLKKIILIEKKFFPHTKPIAKETLAKLEKIDQYAGHVGVTAEHIVPYQEKSKSTVLPNFIVVKPKRI